ncbi:hypothetical protein B0H10DRAFT_1953181 [Mycena sp. CBHHK59/15]|nr:hypothetical protein B0H10DRAFT_1953181 [Mycena sp. CBHHK59/15]
MSDTPSPPEITRSFILTWGFQFIGYTLDTALWGVGILLVLQYFRKYAKKDPLMIQIVVGILGTLAAANSVVVTNHSIFLAKMNYADYVSLFGNFEGQNGSYMRLIGELFAAQSIFTKSVNLSNLKVVLGPLKFSAGLGPKFTCTSKLQKVTGVCIPSPLAAT